jgi:3-methylcrotonyl-CoA carboxylase alpha subunit
MRVSFDLQFLEITPCGDYYCATFKGEDARVEVLRAESGKMDLLIDGRRVTAYVSSDMAKRWVTINGRTALLTKTSGAKTGVRHEHAGGLTAPMPGQVRSVSVGVGDAVKSGQTLVVLEAMKMEIRIQALRDGRVKTVHVTQGQTVEREQILIEMED